MRKEILDVFGSLDKAAGQKVWGKVVKLSEVLLHWDWVERCWLGIDSSIITPRYEWHDEEKVESR